MTSAAVELPGAATVRAQVTAVVDRFLADKARIAAEWGMPGEVTQCLRDFMASGGKRLRSLLCVTGWQAAGAQGDLDPVVRVAASLEMFHAFCLIHDDIMDESDSRRGAPTIHRRLAVRYGDDRGGPAAERAGAGAAILIGDLALAWSDELLHTAGLTPRQFGAVLPLIDVMRSEVVYGQYLDVTASGRPAPGVARALKTARYKTAKYTVERPLHIGAALAGADGALLAALSRFALPLGEAFQLRDDLLGVFGAPATTGKPVLDDLRGGRHTVLLALAAQRADAAQRNLLDRLVGSPDLDPDGAARVRRVLEATGARATVEAMIGARHGRALAALEDVPLAPCSLAALRRIAAAAVERAS
ncbi:polyprenyl synthetase family protein [Streptomyces sp. NPDC059917]|uniref:polyprenyl synthetase family protein n=1 Tax=Streptomyces sp. NPDC059917 TaxID=3347002 RepID=UPI00366897CE